MKTLQKLSVISFCLLMVYACKDEDKNNNGGDDGTYPSTFSEQARSPKKGVSFTFQVKGDVDALAPAISWSYNWAINQSEWLDAPFAEHKLDFFPMAWNGVNETELRKYIALHPECKYILGYNEPNLTGAESCNLTPQQAAERWPKLKAIANELNLKIISPAVNYGNMTGYEDPVKWLDDFFKLVPLSDVEGIAIHCYMPSAAAMKTFIERFKKYKKPIWVTEFCAYDGNSVTLASQMKYMCDIISYMEADPDVLRYAWFIPRNDEATTAYPYMHLLTERPNELTNLGKVFVNMSTQDKNLWYIVGQRIEAEHFNATCVSDSIGASGFMSGPSMRPTTDEEGTLELFDFVPKQWVEYQINIPVTKTYTLTTRYACFRDSKADVFIDGNEVTTISYPKTGQEYKWDTNATNIQLSKGKHILRMKVTEGVLCLNWLSIQ
ncbi:MAG: carbohydrate-binding protein [Prevotellaceae bacterium]|jgi:hypothetical protein|nr:carbohydrate-binding protein [Prevotellaceae bacterium]